MVYFLCPSVNVHLSCFHLGAIVTNAAINIFYLNICFHFSWVYTWIKIAGSYSSLMLNLWRNCQAVFQSISTSRIWGFQCLHTFGNTYYLLFFIINILVGVKWYLIMVLICVFLTANDVEHLPMNLVGSLFSKCFRERRKRGNDSWKCPWKALFLCF